MDSLIHFRKLQIATIIISVIVAVCFARIIRRLFLLLMMMMMIVLLGRFVDYAIPLCWQANKHAVVMVEARMNAMLEVGGRRDFWTLFTLDKRHILVYPNLLFFLFVKLNVSKTNVNAPHPNP